MNNTKYTFLLPAYKARYLEEALLSIQSQSYTDYKVLVSDDCSPEDLKSVFDKVCGDDSRFTYRRNEKNMGGESLVSHWNLLVDMCETEWLIMASDDDVYEPTFLEEIDKLIQKYYNVNVFRSKAQRLTDGMITEKDGDIPEFLEHEEFLLYFGYKKMVHCLANYVFRTNELKRNGYFPDFPKAAKSDSAAAMLMSKNGVATTRNICFTFRISSINLSSPQKYQIYSEQGLIGCLMFADWFKRNIRPNIHYSEQIKNAHYHHVTDIAIFFLNNVSLSKSIKYLYKLRNRDFITIKNIATIFKNRLKKLAKHNF